MDTIRRISFEGGLNLSNYCSVIFVFFEQSGSSIYITEITESPLLGDKPAIIKKVILIIVQYQQYINVIMGLPFK